MFTMTGTRGRSARGVGVRGAAVARQHRMTFAGRHGRGHHEHVLPGRKAAPVVRHEDRAHARSVPPQKEVGRIKGAPVRSIVQDVLDLAVEVPKAVGLRDRNDQRDLSLVHVPEDAPGQVDLLGLIAQRGQRGRQEQDDRLRIMDEPSQEREPPPPEIAAVRPPGREVGDDVASTLVDDVVRGLDPEPVVGEVVGDDPRPRRWCAR